MEGCGHACVPDNLRPFPQRASGRPGRIFEALPPLSHSSPHPSRLLQVIIFGHSPPGKFERDYSSTGHHWLDHASNRRFVHLVRTFSDVIVGQFFGHQHTDSFRLFKDVAGETERKA